MGADERIDLLFLQYLTFFPIDILRRMTEAAGGKAALRSLPGNALFSLGITPGLIQIEQYETARQPDFLKREEEQLMKKGIRFVSEDDPDFPARLKNIPDAPFGIFVRGILPDAEAPAVALVGARNCSPYGRESAFFFGRELANAGVNVISGMALGIDGYAGRGALEQEGRSFAVLGGGADLCYPASNVDLYRGLLERGGVISERPPGYRARQADFPLRNRIISGLSDIVCVIEAAEHSGSLITADHALQQGREVFALPGRIDDPLSYSCNALIRNGASMLTCPEDLLSALGRSVSGEHGKPKRVLLDKEEEALVSCMRSGELSIDGLIESSGLPFSEIASLLLQLEMKGVVTRGGGGTYLLKEQRKSSG